MNSETELVASAPRRGWVPWFVLSSALLLTAAATIYLHMASVIRDRARFRVEVESIRNNIEDNLNIYTTMLRSGSGLFAAQENLTQAQFRAFVDRLRLESLYGGIQGIGFTRHILPDELDTVVASMRAQGVFTLDGSDAPTPFRVWPEQPRDEYNAIVYLEPLNRRNQHAIGFDMHTEAVRRAAMDRARDLGEPAATGVVTLVQEIDREKQPGFLIYVPVYRGGAVPATVPERRRQLLGFVYAPFRAHDFFTYTVGQSESRPVALQVFDGSPNEGRELFQSNRGGAALPADRKLLADEVELTAAGRSWTLRFVERPAFSASSASQLVPLVPIAGVALSILLFLLTRLQARARLAAEQTAHDMSVADAALRQSEGRLRRVIESNLVGVVFGDLLGRVSQVNDEYARLVGYSREEIFHEKLSWDRHKVTPEEYHERDAQASRQLKQSGVCAPYEKELITKSGERRPVLVGAALLDDSPGECVAVVVDLTERKRAEQQRLELLESERTARQQAEAAQRRLAFLAEASRVLSSSLEWEKTLNALAQLAVPVLADWCIVHAVGLDGSLRRVAVVGADASKCELAEALRRSPVDPVALGEAQMRVLRDGEPQLMPEFSELGQATTEQQRLVQQIGARSLVMVPLRAQGRIVGAIALLHAGSGRRFGREDLEFAEELAGRASTAVDNALLYMAAHEARAEAERAAHVKDQFLATVSHELRTPLNAILGWSQLLTSEADPEELAQGLEAIERNARAQSQLVEDLLDVSRIVAGKLRIDTKRVDAASVVEAAMDTVRPAASAKNIALEAKLQPAIVSGDPNRLQQVVWNLLSNAVKFTPTGGRVWLEMHRQDGEVCIAVSDNGQGISPEFVPQLFTAFRQADGSTTRRHSGLGLGLAIVRHLVELHGGRVWVQSAGRGHGATFTISLPLLVDEPQSASEPATEPSEAGALLARRPLEEIRVVVVDDEPDVRRLATLMLGRAGAEVQSAGSAAEAIELVRRFRPHVIVSDIAMPEHDGFWLLEEVRRLPAAEGGRTPAVAMTAFARAEDRHRTAAAGFKIHLSKPVAPEDLVAAVAGLAGQALVEQDAPGE